jgi:hypothetical protein
VLLIDTSQSVLLIDTSQSVLLIDTSLYSTLGDEQVCGALCCSACVPHRVMGRACRAQPLVRTGQCGRRLAGRPVNTGTWAAAVRSGAGEGQRVRAGA